MPRRGAPDILPPIRKASFVPKFSANLSLLFGEHEPLDRLAAAESAGFEGVEIQFPYVETAERWIAAKRRTDLQFALINVPVGDMMDGGPGLAAMPGREDQFQKAVAQCTRYIRALDVPTVNVLAGWPPAELGRERCMETFVSNIAYAARVMEDYGVRVVIEACNTRDRPGFFISTSAEAMQAIEWAGHANLGFQYDLYHMQIMEGDLVPTIERNIERIGHIQFADTPGRAEPGTGEINFPFVFQEIDRLGYKGWVGAEYAPGFGRKTEDTLDWFQPYRRRR